MKKGEITGNFRLHSIESLPEFMSEGRYFIHEKTGCELYHLYNDNPENLFSFIFRTIPSDNTGVAHIVEHSVLAGSEKYPLKDPFVQLLKSSMYTFLNAMTYPDKTVYPASSTVEADYFNLMSVYGDAVFFPLLREETFLQEGIRIEKKEDGSYRYGGVVYNEMKGNYSDHNMVLAEWSGRSLFPDTSYRFDSGGVPEEIRKLKYRDFRKFHEKNYHPSNCRIFLYGNIDTERQLSFIESNFLSRFEKAEKSSPAQIQKKHERPVYLKKHSHSDNGNGTTSITVNWLCGDSTDPLEALEMEILSELLVGSSGSPLYLAIINSGIGEDLSPVSGLDAGSRQIVFSAGIRGTSESRRDSYTELVDRTLEEIYEKGFDSDLLEGTLRQFEFAHREIKGGRPEGLKLMDMCSHGWLHDFHPSKTLAFEKLMKTVREKISSDKTYFENLLKESLIKNMHRSIVTVMPGRVENQEKEIDSDTPLPGKETAERGNRETLLFEKYHSENDTAEDIAKIPVLTKDDIPRDIDTIECFEKHDRGLGAFIHEFHTAGITYTDLFYDISGMDEELKYYLPLFSRFVREAGLPGIPYYETAKMLSLKTGGFYMAPESGMHLSGRTVEMMGVHYKALTGRYEEASEFIFRLLYEADFGDLTRLGDIIREILNDQKSMIIRRGNYIAAVYASRFYTESLARQEQWSGISQLLFLQALDPDDGKSLSKTSDSLKKICEYLKKTQRVILNLTSGVSSSEKCYSCVSRYLPSCVSREFSLASEDPAVCYAGPGAAGNHECIVAPSLVSFSSAVMPAARTGSEEFVYERLLSRIIETGYLWDKVRMEGGAYGVSASLNGMEGLFSFSSYRDPRLAETFQAFMGSLESVSEKTLDRGTLLKAVISGVGKEIRPLAPGEKGLLDARRKIYGLVDSIRQKSRDTMLSASPPDIISAAGRIRERFDSSSRCVLTGREIFEKNSDFFNSKNFRRIDLNI